MVKKKTESYESLKDKGLELISETQTIIHNIDFPTELLNPDVFAGARLAGEYHKWVESISEFLELNHKDELEISFFKEADGIPTIEHLDEYNQIGEEFITPSFATKIIEEIRKKLEHIREIARRDSKEEQFNEITELDSLKKPRTSIDEKAGLGYLTFHKQKILIGEIESGKFKLLETLCNESFGRIKTIDVVFEIIRVQRDKNKKDSFLDSEFFKQERKLELIKNQIKEINRIINNYVKNKKIKNFKYRFSLKSENNHIVGLKERVGRRG